MGQHIIQKLNHLVEIQAFPVLNLWVVVCYIFHEELMVESNLIDKLHELLNDVSVTLGFRVWLSEELASKMYLSFSMFSFSVMEKSIIFYYSIVSIIIEEGKKDDKIKSVAKTVCLNIPSQFLQKFIFLLLGFLLL